MCDGVNREEKEADVDRLSACRARHVNDRRARHDTEKKKTADSNIHMSKNANSAWDARNGLHENAWPKTDVTKPQKERKIYIYIYTQENTSPSYCYYNYSLLRCLYVLYRYV